MKRHFMPYILSQIVSLLALLVASEHCKCTPNTSCYPGVSEWVSLNQSVHGALIATKPLASVCYRETHWDDYDRARCESIRSRWFSSALHAADPTSVDYLIWTNDSCDAIFDNGTSVTGDSLAGARGCTLGAGGGGRGRGGGYPYYVLNASTADQISTALKWAAEHDVRVIIKNTGHNVPGRSSGWGSLSIWTHNLKSFELHPSWKPTGVPHAHGQLAATIGAGIQDHELYEFTNRTGHIAVGGADPNVGAVGWMTGGGHGWLSSTYGMGADNLLQATVVLANGEVVIANENSQPDLFWALRGGGGGTFGVVTEVTVKAFETPKTASLKIAIAQLRVDDNTTRSFYDLMGDFHHELVDWKAAGLQGYYGILGPPSTGSLYLWATFYFYDTPLSKAQAVLRPFEARLDKVGVQGWADCNLTWGEEMSSYYDVYVSNEPQLVAQTGFAYGSWLLSTKSLSTDVGKISETLQRVGPKAINPLKSLSNPLVFGHVTANSKNRALDVALNPAWRDAVSHLIVQVGWQDGSPQHVIEAAYNDITNVKVPALKELSPHSGAYFNEADAFEPDWQHAFFGKNYPRLQAIKERYDPRGIFWCRSCVGSREWVERVDGKLCKVI